MVYITEKIAIIIGKKARIILNVDEDNEKIIIYGAISLLQILWAILWTLAISMVFSVVYEAMIFTIVVSALKKYSGGAHASSPGRCVFIGVTIATMVGVIIKILLCKQNIITVAVLGIVCTSIGFFIVMKYAPVDSANKPIASAKMRQKLKRNSEIILFLYTILLIIMLLLFRISSELYFIKAYECISLGVLWQSITLTNSGIKILNKIDFVLHKVSFILNFKIIKGGN